MQRKAQEIDGNDWLKAYSTEELARQAEGLPLRRDMVTLLTYVRDHTVTGTQSTGNMPLKAVREVTALFVNPPVLDPTSGDRTYKLRSEADVWPLYFLHILAEVGNLLRIERGRKWRLLPAGEAFLTLEPLQQVASLLEIWWYDVNWLVAFSVSGMGTALPPYLGGLTLAHLRALPVGERVPFEAFADELVAAAGLRWRSPNREYAHKGLRSAVRYMVVDILSNFGILEAEHREEKGSWRMQRKVVAFHVTPLGEALLEFLALRETETAHQWITGTENPYPEGALFVRHLHDEMWTFEYPRIDWDTLEEFHAAIELWWAGRVVEAEAEYRRLIAEFPEFIDAYHHLALLLNYTGREPEAHEIWQRTVEMGLKVLPETLERGSDELPWSVLENRPFLRAYHALGLHYLGHGDVVEALKIFEHMLDLNPGDNQGVRALAIDGYFRLGDPASVLEICKRYPGDGMEQVIYGRALALYQLGRRAEAKEALCQAIEWLPLVGQELVKDKHEPPPDMRPDRITLGGADQAYAYWQEQGRYWERTYGALDLVEECLREVGDVGT